jgi:hypothetical protein
MCVPLEEYYGVQPLTPTPLELPALEKKKLAAVDTLYGMADRITFMNSADPRVQDMHRAAALAVFYVESMELAKFSPYEICKYAEESSAKLEARVTAYEKSKAEYGQKSTEYSRVSNQFSRKLKETNISSAPLDFSRGAKPPATRGTGVKFSNGDAPWNRPAINEMKWVSPSFSNNHAPWDRPGINEMKWVFPSKESIVSLVKQDPLVTKNNNPYLREQKVINRVAESLAGQEMDGLSLKHRVILIVGKLRDEGALENVLPSYDSGAWLHSVYAAFARCAVTEQMSMPSSAPLKPQSNHGVDKERVDILVSGDAFY